MRANVLKIGFRISKKKVVVRGLIFRYTKITDERAVTSKNHFSGLFLLTFSRIRYSDVFCNFSADRLIATVISNDFTNTSDICVTGRGSWTARSFVILNGCSYTILKPFKPLKDIIAASLLQTFKRSFARTFPQSFFHLEIRRTTETCSRKNVIK